MVKRLGALFAALVLGLSCGPGWLGIGYAAKLPGVISYQGAQDAGATLGSYPTTVAGTDSSGVIRTLRTDSSGLITVTGTTTADTELPAAAALADDTANPTAPAVGSFLHGFDGTTWDRIRVDSTGTGNLKTAIFDGATRANIATPATDNVGAGTYNGLAVLGFNHLLDSAGNWDREQSITGTHANAWSAVTLATTGNSTSLNVNHWPHVSAFGTLSSIGGTWDLYLQVSQDDTNWYNHTLVLDDVTTNRDFEIDATVAALYTRLRLVEVANGDVTVTATISGKRG